MLRPISLGIALLLGLAGCAKSDAAAPPVPKPVAAQPIIPTATPIRPAAVAAPDVTGDDEDVAFEMPAEVVERRERREVVDRSTTTTTTPVPSPRPYREPILSDDLGLLDDQRAAPAPAKAAAPAPAKAAAPAPAKAAAPETNPNLDASDLALIEATTKTPAAAPRATAPAETPTPAPPAPSTSTVSLGPTTSISVSSLSPTDVRKTIQRKYLGAVRSCHAEAPDQSGSVTVQINVGPDGRVALARAMGFSSAVDACIKAAARSWRFDVPRDGAGQPTTAPYKTEFRMTR
jgi:outer membrane biosynthesis protein TonB